MTLTTNVTGIIVIVIIISSSSSTLISSSFIDKKKSAIGIGIYIVLLILTIVCHQLITDWPRNSPAPLINPKLINVLISELISFSCAGR